MKEQKKKIKEEFRKTTWSQSAKDGDFFLNSLKYNTSLFIQVDIKYLSSAAVVLTLAMVSLYKPAHFFFKNFSGAFQKYGWNIIRFNYH